MSAERNVEQSCTVWEQALESALFINEFIKIIIIIIIILITKTKFI